MEKVSIVVPVYNAKNYIKRCIESLVCQTYHNLEIILVDDGSSDGSEKICDEYAKEDDRIKVIHKKNSGVSDSRNAGIEAADGDYILFVDSDDYINENTVEDNLKTAIEKNADIVIFCFKYIITDSNEEKDNGYGEDFSGNAEAFFRQCLVKIIDKELLNAPWNKLIKTNLIKNNNLSFKPEYSICEDMIFSVETISASSNIVINSKIYYNYVLKSTGSLVFGFYPNYFDALSEFYLKSSDYNNKYHDNLKQKKCIDSKYAKLAIMYLKQIVCESEWEKDKCVNKISEITNNPMLRTALDNADLNYKKSLVRFLIKHRLSNVIYYMYHLKGKL